MTKIEKIKIKLEALDEDPTAKQLLGILWDILDVIDDKGTIGFRDDKKKK